MSDEEYLALVELAKTGQPMTAEQFEALDTEARARVAAKYAEIGETEQ